MPGWLAMKTYSSISHSRVFSDGHASQIFRTRSRSTSRSSLALTRQPVIRPTGCSSGSVSGAGSERQSQPRRSERKFARASTCTSARSRTCQARYGVLEGCATALLGTVPEATIVRFDVERPRVGFLQYPDFDTEPHPELAGVFVVSLDNLRSDYVDYSERGNLPIIHRKELFVAEDYPHRERFARLTRQEVKAGLFGDASRIGTLHGWNEALAGAGMDAQRPPSDPRQVDQVVDSGPSF